MPEPSVVIACRGCGKRWKIVRPGGRRATEFACRACGVLNAIPPGADPGVATGIASAGSDTAPSQPGPVEPLPPAATPQSATPSTPQGTGTPKPAARLKKTKTSAQRSVPSARPPVSGQAPATSPSEPAPAGTAPSGRPTQEPPLETSENDAVSSLGTAADSAVELGGLATELDFTGDLPAPLEAEPGGEPILTLPERRWRRETWLTWGAAVALVACLGFTLWRSRSRDTGELPNATSAANSSGAQEGFAGETEGSGAVSAPGSRAEPTPAAQVSTDPGESPDVAERFTLLDRRLTELEPRIQGIVEREGLFPAGSVASVDLPLPQRFSWLALLAAREEGASAPQWDVAWNAPANDRFVRRQVPAFQNPLIETLVGEDGYPAGHFVGLMGVAEDLLPAVSPRLRRGILQPDTGLSPAEIRDGLSETILATGAGREWGSWGAGGRPTLREFTAPPVIDGADGLGTGTPEVLLVLMADGRVQSLAADIDPQVFASLIAVGDREPDPEPARNLAGPPSATSEPAVGDFTLEAQEEGWLPEWATPEEGAWLEVNMDDRLATVLLSFEQPPAPRESVLRVLEGLVGVPIRWGAVEGDLAEAALRGSVSLSRKNVTIGQLLDAVLQETPLTWRVRGASIHIQSRPEGEPPRGAQPGSGPPGTEQRDG